MAVFERLLGVKMVSFASADPLFCWSWWDRLARAIFAGRNRVLVGAAGSAALRLFRVFFKAGRAWMVIRDHYRRGVWGWGWMLLILLVKIDDNRKSLRCGTTLAPEDGINRNVAFEGRRKHD